LTERHRSAAQISAPNISFKTACLPKAAAAPFEQVGGDRSPMRHREAQAGDAAFEVVHEAEKLTPAAMNKPLARNNKSQDRGQSVPAGDGGGASLLLPLKTARLRTRTPSLLTGSTILTVLLHGLNLACSWRSMSLIPIPRPSQDLADLLATGDGGFGSCRQFDIYQI
jgi:hypothetical protein